MNITHYLALTLTLFSISACSKNSNTLSGIRTQQPTEKSPTNNSNTYLKNDNLYTTYYDGTVVDNKTGIMWARCSVGKTRSNDNCTGSSKAFLYDEALAAINLLNKKKYLGYSDWQLPDIQDLSSLISCNTERNENTYYYMAPAKQGNIEKAIYSCEKRNLHKPTINRRIFPNTDYSYWSSTTDSTSNALHVNFKYGFASTATKSSYRYNIRPMRLPETKLSKKVNRIDQRKNAKVKEITVDRKQGLMWTTCSVGQSWDSGMCVGEAKSLNLKDALNAIKGMNDRKHLGYSDWQLPQKKPHDFVVDCVTPNKVAAWCQGEVPKIPADHQFIYPNPKSLFWATSPDDFRPYSLWITAAPSGLVGTTIRNNYAYYVRAVRLVK